MGDDARKQSRSGNINSCPVIRLKGNGTGPAIGDKKECTEPAASCGSNGFLIAIDSSGLDAQKRSGHGHDSIG
ncbi:hypothetical protein HDF13_003821 [Edaphobacter lichenicola]|uniref:Uncharacterized protein n=1 Tax=Tunturiibacter gelidiferens TaxID=3069689 RepID=A0ACC5P3X5_9BACT|nr:hypothetical protein [Edaphobacter lichenicola]